MRGSDSPFSTLFLDTVYKFMNVFIAYLTQTILTKFHNTLLLYRKLYFSLSFIYKFTL